MAGLGRSPGRDMELSFPRPGTGYGLGACDEAPLNDKPGLAPQRELGFL